MLASLRVENDRCHPMQSSLANASKSATCYVHPAIFFDPTDHPDDIPEKLKNDLYPIDNRLSNGHGKAPL